MNCIKSVIKAKAPLTAENSYGFNALSSSLAYSDKGVNSTLVILLFAAGAKPENDHCADRLRVVLPVKEIKLKHLCRKTIARDLILNRPNVILLIQIPQLKFPTPWKRYLLYMSLEEQNASNWVKTTDM